MSRLYGYYDNNLVDRILSQYILHPDGAHGIHHWINVRNNGVKLAQLNNANEEVVKLFALFHDACRTNEFNDPNHGGRGAQLAYRLFEYLNITKDELLILCRACEYHTTGLKGETDITILTCWDADRLDMKRFGISIDPQYLCTSSALTLI